ncbi:MAG: dihydrolipoamide acetyltransferase family protein, partial [Allobranchiibius sp.]
MPDVIMPRLSDTMTEGILSSWLKNEGDEVHRGDVLAEIETDKATMELEAYEDGILTKIVVQEGATVPIGKVIATIGEPGDSVGSAAAEPPEKFDAAAPDVAGHGPDSSTQVAPSDVRVRATPLVRSLAREQGIDLSTVHGSGPGGRIIRADLADLDTTSAVTQPTLPAPEHPSALVDKSAPVDKPAPAAQQTPAAAVLPAGKDDEKIPLTAIRRITAERLTQSAAAPHFHLTVVVDVTPLLRFRAEVNTQLAADGVKITITDLLIRACAMVLRAHPEVNAAWGGDHIVRRGHVNIGIAVAIDDGLIVPVVRDADRKTAREIGVEARELAGRARAGRLTPDE